MKSIFFHARPSPFLPLLSRHIIVLCTFFTCKRNRPVATNYLVIITKSKYLQNMPTTSQRCRKMFDQPDIIINNSTSYLVISLLLLKLQNTRMEITTQKYYTLKYHIIEASLKQDNNTRQFLLFFFWKKNKNKLIPEM